MFWAIYLAVLFAGWAMMVREGLWSNAISLVNITISGLIAFGFYAPLVVYLDEMTGGSNTYWLDFAIIWGLYAASMLVLRTLTRVFSATRMRFRHPIDPVGGPLVGLVAAWVLATFVMASLHTSPMPRDAFGGRLVTAADVDSAFSFTAPDAHWLRFVESVSGPSALGSSSQAAFSARGFVDIYGNHREAFSESDASWLRVPR